MKVFLDTNVLLDVLARREPWVHDAATLLSIIDVGGASGFVSSHSLATIHYLVAKWHDREQANRSVADLLRLVRVVPLDHEAVLQALALGWPDFEDALQSVCAQIAAADHLVTRDPEDFRTSAVPTLSPSELVALIHARDGDLSP